MDQRGRTKELRSERFCSRRQRPQQLTAWTPVFSNTSEKCSTAPAPLDAITGIVTAPITACKKILYRTRKTCGVQNLPLYEVAKNMKCRAQNVEVPSHQPKMSVGWSIRTYEPVHVGRDLQMSMQTGGKKTTVLRQYHGPTPASDAPSFQGIGGRHADFRAMAFFVAGPKSRVYSAQLC